MEKKLEEIETKCAEEDLDKKEEGIKSLCDLFTECANYEEQI